MVLGRRLYWNADRTKIVEHGDPESAFLAYSESKDVPEDLLKEHGLLAEEKHVAKSANKAKTKAPETK